MHLTEIDPNDYPESIRKQVERLILPYAVSLIDMCQIASYVISSNEWNDNNAKLINAILKNYGNPIGLPVLTVGH